MRETLMKYNRDSVFNEIKRILTTFEIKYTKNADALETPQSERDGYIYLNAYYSTDSLLSYPKLDHRALRRAGITNPAKIGEYLKDRYSIPDQYVDAVIQQQRKIIIEEHIERNPYYRNRMGLPPINEENELRATIALTEEDCHRLDVPIGTMLHELDKARGEDAEKLGIVSKYEKPNHPDYQYLKYIGWRKMELHTMRSAHNFDIIRFIYNPKMESLDNVFMTTYAECREYFMEVIHNRHSSKTFPGYEEFIALMITIMTIQRVFTGLFQMGIQRDFFDLASIEGLFQTYSVPFLGEMDYDTKRVIMKNLNVLLRAKATDKALFDIMSLMGYDRIRINELYLVKEHILDGDGNPIFVYKEVALDEDKPTELTRVFDLEKMFRFHFQAIDKKDPNPLASLSDTRNKRNYIETTINDPDWIEDRALQEYLLREEYNYVKSKYIDMRIMYKLARMIFEATVLFKMITDRKNETSSIRIGLPKFFSNMDLSIFDTVVLTMALIAKNRKMKGNILYTPTQIMSVMGYDFSVDFPLLKKQILSDPHIKDKKLIDHISNMRLSSVEDINTLFSKISDLHEYITQKMYEVDRIEEWRAYQRIHQTLFIANYNMEIFRMSNGEIAPTFREYLMDKNPLYGNFLDRMEEEKELSKSLDYILQTLSKNIVDAKNLYILNDQDEALLNMLLTMLRRFKSLTTRINELGVVYILDSRYYNMITLKCQIRSIHKERSLYELSTPYHDLLSDYLKSLYHSFYIGLKEMAEILVKIPLEDLLRMTEQMTYTAQIDLQDDFLRTYQDTINTLVEIIHSDKIHYHEQTLQNHIFHMNLFLRMDFAHKLETIIRLNTRIEPRYYDNLQIKALDAHKDRIVFRDWLLGHAKISFREDLSLRLEDHITTTHILKDDGISPYRDSVSKKTEIPIGLPVTIRETLRIKRETTP